MNKKKKKRIINVQKIFCFSSFIFILICIFWYGGRFIYFYHESKKIITEEATVFARVVKSQNSNNENFKQIGQNYYFYGDSVDNYVRYSNLLWRIIKVNDDNSIVLISDNIISTLAYGDSTINYSDSNLLYWLNGDENSSNSVFLSILNEKEKYLLKNSVCIDNIDDTSDITCDEVSNENYLDLLSVNDYIYTGGNNGFINNERYNYLANKNDNDEIWYINTEGKLDVSSGEDILGIKPVITIKANIEIKNGTGSLDDPYVFEDTNSLIGSYVKLGNDFWRIYEENEEIVKLVLQDTITVSNSSNQKLEYEYSKNGYYHNDTVSGSLAYYLNHTYYNSLSYKDLIVENSYSNGFYGNDNDYKYEDVKENTIETKVAVPSIGDIVLNDTLDNYFIGTGVSEKSALIYIQKEKGIVTSDNSTVSANVVPCISISKTNLTVGSGSYSDPYRTE